MHTPSLPPSLSLYQGGPLPSSARYRTTVTGDGGAARRAQISKRSATFGPTPLHSTMNFPILRGPSFPLAALARPLASAERVSVKDSRAYKNFSLPTKLCDGRSVHVEISSYLPRARNLAQRQARQTAKCISIPHARAPESADIIRSSL